jgi:hypothetical protein
VVSPELRAAEREIDNVPLRNALVEQPFSQAAWRFMAANEERVMREIVKADETGTSKHDQYYAALFDSIVVSTKWPMRWLLGKCRAGDKVPQEFDDDGYVAANELSDLGQDYSHFEAAFTYASLGVLTLALEDRSIRASDEFRRGTRYDAYDRLRQKTLEDLPIHAAVERPPRMRPLEDLAYSAPPRRPRTTAACEIRINLSPWRATPTDLLHQREL